MKPEKQSDGCYEAVTQVAERLISLLQEEDRVSKLYPKDILGVVDYLERAASARSAVDQCAREYSKALAECGFPDLPIRGLIEFDERVQRHCQSTPIQMIGTAQAGNQSVGHVS